MEKVNVVERFLLLQLLSDVKGDFLTAKVARKLKTDLGFDEDELKLHKFEQSPDGPLTIQEPDKNKDIEIGEKAQELIVNKLKELDKRKEFHTDFVDLYIRFIGDKDE